MALTSSFHRIPIAAGTTSSRVQLHSGLSRHYPAIHGNLVERDGGPRRVGAIIVHPTSIFLTHFLLTPIAAAGLPIVGLNTRYAGNDAAVIMENAALDLGAGVRWMKDRLGFEQVVLLGFSGGGSLVAYYQSQAEDPTVTATPAGDPPDLTAAELVPADGVMLVGAHTGRTRLLRDWIDPSIVDELHPDRRDPRLDLFREDRRLPFDRDWIEAYRAAQDARMRRITAWAVQQLDELDGGDRAFVVHGTVADPRFLDLSLDPSDRAPGSMYGPPQGANLAAGGLARFTTCRSWLSSWAPEYAYADAPTNPRSVTVPTLIMSLLADQAAFPSDSKAMFEAAPVGRSQLVAMSGVNHYMLNQPGAPDAVAAEIVAWLARHGIGTAAASS